MTKLYSGSTGKGNGGVSTATSSYLNQAPRTVAEVEAEMGLRPKRTVAEYRAYLLDEHAKALSAVRFGITTGGNLTWAKAKLAQIETRLADLGEEG